MEIVVSIDLANWASLVTEWRIQKRVEAQFNAFVTGFNELIPPDLVNVFDERELELLIGGIADIDVEDWKKHTDYRGYTEQDEVIRNFWTVSTRYAQLRLHILMRCCSVFEAGTQSRNHDYSNSRPVHLVSLSTASRIFKEAMDREDLRLRSLDLTRRYQSHILGMFNPIPLLPLTGNIYTNIQPPVSTA